MLFAQTIKYPPGGMALLAMHSTIPVQPSVDDLGEPVQFWALDRNRPPVTGRHRERYRLVDSVARDVKERLINAFGCAEMAA